MYNLMPGTEQFLLLCLLGAVCACLGTRILSVSTIDGICQPGNEHTCSGKKHYTDESKKYRMGKSKTA